MPGFVAGDTQRGKRPPVVHLRGKAQHLVGGVIVVREQSVGAPDAHIRDAGAAQHLGGGGGARHAGACLHAGIFGERGFDPRRKNERKHKRRKAEKIVEGVQSDHGNSFPG